MRGGISLWWENREGFLGRLYLYIYINISVYIPQVEKRKNQVGKTTNSVEAEKGSGGVEKLCNHGLERKRYEETKRGNTKK